MQEKSAQLLTYLYWCLWSIISKELGLAVLSKSCEKNPVQLWFCLKLTSKRYAQLWFCLKCAPIACAKEGAQLKIYLSRFEWTIISKKLWFAVLDKTCKTQRAQPCCCSQLASGRTVQLSFCFKLARIVRKQKPVRNCVRNFPFNQNWWLLLKS